MNLRPPRPVRLAVLTALLGMATSALVAASSAAAAPPGGNLPAFTVPRGLDPVAAAALIAAHHDHGSGDDNLAEPAVAAVALVRKVQLTCTPAANWAVHTMRAAGYQARVVASFNTANRTGHTMMETRTARGWVVLDVDLDLWFWKDGHPMSFLEFDWAVRNGEPYEIRPLSGTHTAPPDMKQRYAASILVPMVRLHGTYWFFTVVPGRAAVVARYASDYVGLSRSRWMAEFYPGGRDPV